MKQHIDEVRKAATEGPFEASPQKGKPNHCLVAQIFDCDDESVMHIDPTPDESEATATALLTAHCLNTHQMLLDALKPLWEKCFDLDAEGCLDETITGDMLYAAGKAIDAAEWVEAGE